MGYVAMRASFKAGSSISIFGATIDEVMASQVYPIALVVVVAVRTKSVTLNLSTLANGRNFRKVAKIEIDCKVVVGDSHVLVFWIHLEPFNSSVVLTGFKVNCKLLTLSR